MSAASAASCPGGWEAVLPTFEADEKGMATRAASGKVLGRLVPAVPELIGGSADLTPSNKTRTETMRDFSRAHPEGRYLRFGVREHGMGAILNGLALHGGFRPYGGTFLIFSDYMRPPIRLAALMEQPVLFVFTHDSVGLGEDGPTHQPVEQLMSLRAIPNLALFRAGRCQRDGRGVAMCSWAQRWPQPRSPLRARAYPPSIARATPRPKGCGAAPTSSPICEGVPDVLLLATGSEVHLALEAQNHASRRRYCRPCGLYAVLVAFRRARHVLPAIACCLLVSPRV